MSTDQERMTGEGLKAGRELDALVASRVMGWRRMTEGEIHPGQRFDEVYPSARAAGFDRTRVSNWWFDATKRDADGDAVAMAPAEDADEFDRFAPSTNIADAWSVVEEMARCGWIVVKASHKGPKLMRCERCRDRRRRDLDCLTHRRNYERNRRKILARQREYHHRPNVRAKRAADRASRIAIERLDQREHNRRVRSTPEGREPSRATFPGASLS